MLAIFIFPIGRIGNTLLVTFTCFLSAFLFGLTVAVLRRLSPSTTEDTRRTGLYSSGNSNTYCCFSCLFWIAIDWHICFTSGGHEPQRRLNQWELSCRGVQRALKLVEPYEITVAKVAGMRQLQVIINIELPQMLRFSVPGIINEFSSVLKRRPLLIL